MIAMLKDPEFCEDAWGVIEKAKALYLEAPTQEEFAKKLVELTQPFRARWGVLPPQTGELLDADPRRRVVEAIASGDWGIVPVFPRTTDREIHARVKTIRSTISKWHKDALKARKVQLVAWLEDCGFDRKAVARAVHGWTKGLSRPTIAQAIARAARENPERETELYQQYCRQYRELRIAETEVHKLAQRRVYRTLQGSEAPVAAALRMADRRYLGRGQRLNTNLATPIKSEPLSHALTTLFRALDKDNATVRQHAIHVKVVFMGDPVEPAAPDQPSIAGPHSRQLEEAIESGQWGVVPVFPWTTDQDVSALVKSIKHRIRPPRRDRGHPAQPPATSPESEPYSPALTRLFGTLAHKDDAAVQRHARAALASFLTAFPS